MNSISIRSNNLTKLSTDQLDFILLDGSASMNSKWWDMLAAIDAYIAGLKAQHLKTHILLHVFDDSDLKLEGRNTHIDQWKTFDEDPLGAHFGSTPLYDAIVIMGSTIRDLNPQKCAVTIVTDGGEAGSKFANIDQARAVLDWLRAQGFSVTFIGCDFDNDNQARSLGANASNSIGVRKELLTSAAKRYAEKRVQNARSGDDISFTSDEKQKFGGYLSHGG